MDKKYPPAGLEVDTFYPVAVPFGREVQPVAVQYVERMINSQKAKTLTIRHSDFNMVQGLPVSESHFLQF